MATIQERVIKELGEALKLFGTYSFDDKGPHEVMSITPFVNELRAMPAVDAAATIIEIAKVKKHGGRALQVAENLVHGLDDWDELFALPGIEDIYNGDPPGKPRDRPAPVFIDCGRPVAVFDKLLGEWKPLK